jgi:choline dehydrogenase-like flavoprotein
MSNPQTDYDVVIVGAGASGSILAKQLGLAGKKVLVLEAGAGVPPNINAFMQRFYTSVAKTPESPYTPDLFTPPGSGNLTDPSTLAAGRPTVLTLRADNWQDPHQAYLIQQGPKAFASTYERVAGGTMRHWLGTSLRFLPNDFQMQTVYQQEVNWPITYDELDPWYCKAEAEIGVSANVAEQSFLGITFPQGYNYPMQAIPHSLVDDAVDTATQGMTWESLPVNVTGTPAGRNSQPYQNRRVCAGNTNCIPICPIQAKYDPSVSLNNALDTGNVTVWPQTVASHVTVGEDKQVSGIDYIQYQQVTGPATASGTVTAKIYVIAAHAIETPRLLLMSKNGGRYPNGIANTSGCVGQNLMDHPLYLAWALAPQPVYPYRGPLATAGIESLRDGAFRSERAAFRIEIGNEGWNFAVGDPDTTTIDFINGMNVSQLNPPAADETAPSALWGSALVTALNHGLSRQFRLGFLVEQSPEATNYVSLSDELDPLGLPRPEIHYDLSDYTRKGFVAAKQVADAIFAKMGATQYTTTPAANDPTSFEYEVDGKPTRFKYFGAGHIVGTYRMGSDPCKSVVDANQRSWDHSNLYLVGSGTFPTVTTANPTLTIAAFSLKTADAILQQLG